MAFLPKLRILIGSLALMLGTSAHAAHYKVFLLGGQSNMQGNNALLSQLPPNLQPPQDDVLLYSETNSAAFFGSLQVGAGNNFGPEVSFGRTIADGRPHDRFCLIKFAQGATNLHTNWDPATGNVYDLFRSTVSNGIEALTKAGHTYEIVGMCWTQGENDVQDMRTTAQYEEDLNEFIADIRTRYGAGVKFFISRLSDNQTWRPASQVNEIRTAQDNAAAADPLSCRVDTDGFGMRADNLHFEETGYVDIGEAFGQAYLNSLPVDSTAPAISTLSPANTVSGVDPTADLTITFTEDITFGTGAIRLMQTGGTPVEMESFDVASPPAHLTLSGATITINPTALLSPTTGYYLEIDATAIDDLAGNSFNGISGDGTWSFITSAADTTPPAIASLNPAHTATRVPFNSTLTITFTENIAFGSGNITLRQTGGTLVESYDVTNPSGNLTIAGASFTINPTEDLLPLVGYYVEIDTTAIDDHAGNSFPGFTSDGTWSFTTTASLIDGSKITGTASLHSVASTGATAWHPKRSIDGTGLSAGTHGSTAYTGWMTSFVNPANHWVQWDLGASYTLDSIHVWNFNNQGDTGSGIRSVDIYYSNVAIPGDPEGIGAVNWTKLGGAAVELPQAPASGNTGFDLETATSTTLPSTEIRYIRFELNSNWQGGNYRTGLAEIQFLAGPIGPDAFAPGVSSFSPANSAVEVDPTSNLVITFNEDVAFGSGNITLRQSGGALIESFDLASPPVGLTLSGDTVTINPTADLTESTTYYVEIDGTAIDDLSGNPFSGFSGDGSWSFTTVTPDTTKPEIASLSPTNGQNFFSPTGNLVITFTEEVTFGTGEIRLRRSDGTLIESFDVANPPSGLTLSVDTVTIHPTDNLALSTNYYLEIADTAIDDLAGNVFDGFLSNGTWSFTTAASLQVGRVDASGFYDVTTNAVITTDVLDYGYVNLPGNRYNGGSAVQGLFELDHTNVRWDDIAGSEGQKLTAQGGTARITSVSLTGGQNDIQASFNEPAGFSFNGANAYGQFRSGSQNTDFWTLNFNDLGVGTFTVTLFLGGKDDQTHVGRITYSLDDGGPAITGTTLSANTGSYFNTNARNLYTYQITVTTTTDTADLSLNFGTASRDNNVVNPYLSGYTIVAAAAANTFADWIDGYTGLGGLTACDDDADGDGIPNGVENYFGTHPGGFSQGIVAQAFSGNTFTFSHPLNDTPASDLAAGYRWSKDLSSFHDDEDAFEGTTVSFSQSAPADGMVVVTATIAGTPIDRLFVDVKVVQNYIPHHDKPANLNTCR